MAGLTSQPGVIHRRSRCRIPARRPTWSHQGKDLTATNTYGGANGSGPIASRIDRNGDEIAYEYDADGRLWKKTLPDNEVTTYTYDAFGHLHTASNTSAFMNFTYR